MNINNAYPSKWIKSGDLESGDLTLTIAGIKMEKVELDSNSTKPVVYFHEIPKGLVLNRTNAEAISQMHTPETDNWPGKRITLFLGQAEFRGRPTTAVRVKLQTAHSPASGGSSVGAQQPIGKISREQRLQICNLAEKNGWMPQEVTQKLGQFGYETTADIPIEAFESVRAIFQNPIDPKIPF